MHNNCNTDWAAHTTRRTTSAPDPHRSTFRHMCHLQRRITTQLSGRTPVPASALHQHPQRAPSDDTWLPLSDLPSGQTQGQGLPQTPLPEQPAPAHSSSPTAVSAPGPLPGHWLAHLHVPNLHHRQRLCDEPNQAHPPTAPTALEWKHPVDARQQLSPQISRRVSCPRGTEIFAHCRWPGCLTPRPRLPASLRHNLRTPRRVRRQHIEVAVLMLARRWYQCRNPTRNSLALSRSSVPA